MGSNSYFGINYKIYASEFGKVKIGFSASINSHVMINAGGKGSISIGDNVLIGFNLVLRSSNHSFHTTKITCYR
tara:strand:+ start:2084 stop:2305 length:222 start_codon:yes stop_codon:yes gene_type:complete